MDETIRKLQRKSEETKSYEDVAAYWRACLKAGIIPVTADDYKWILERPYINYGLAGSLFSEGHDRVAIWRSKMGGYHEITIYSNGHQVSVVAFPTEKDIIEWLRWALDEMADDDGQ